MNHPIIASANGNERYNRMVDQAEKFRRMEAISASQPKKRILGKYQAKFASQLPQVTGKSADSPA